MEWIDTWDCKNCGATNSESRDGCHKCGFRRKRLLKPAMVPWVIVAFIISSIAVIKVYLDKSEHTDHGDNGVHHVEAH